MNIMNNLFFLRSLASNISKVKEFTGLPYVVNTKGDYTYNLTGKTKNFTVEIKLYFTTPGFGHYQVWITDYKGVEAQVAKHGMGFLSIIEFPHKKEIIDFIHGIKSEIKNAKNLKIKKEKEKIELRQKKEKERLDSLSVKP